MGSKYKEHSVYDFLNNLNLKFLLTIPQMLFSAVIIFFNLPKILLEMVDCEGNIIKTDN